MKKFIYLILISSLINAAERRALRARYKDDQYQWITPTPAQIDRCGICFEPGKIKNLSCHQEHKFHSFCIEKWREVNNSCPLCRTEIVDSILFTCIESMAKPAVCIPACAAIVTLIKSGERILNYVNILEAISPTCEQHCNGCVCFCMYCMTSLAVGPALHYITNKRD